MVNVFSPLFIKNYTILNVMSFHEKQMKNQTVCWFKLVKKKD